MFRQYRPIEEGEFILVGGDCSQGGDDYNACAFLSKTHIDVPLVYHSRGVAATMTTAIFPVLESIFDKTGLKPVVALEQNNGGISEMERLAAMNRLSKYRLFTMPHIGKERAGQSTGKLGYNTNAATRPILLGDWKNVIDNEIVTLYDEPTITEHFIFIINDRGKPEHEENAHDDLIFAHAIAWQLYQTEDIPKGRETLEILKYQNRERTKKWELS